MFYDCGQYECSDVLKTGMINSVLLFRCRIIASLSIMSAIIGSSAENIAMIFACRIFAGMAMGLGFQAPVMYIAEVRILNCVWVYT